MAFSMAEWMADLGKAAEELGYGIRSIGPSSDRTYHGTEVVLEGVDHIATRVSITSVLMSGPLLRRLLVPLKPVPSEEVESLFASAQLPDEMVEERLHGR